MFKWYFAITVAIPKLVKIVAVKLPSSDLYIVESYLEELAGGCAVFCGFLGFMLDRICKVLGEKRDVLPKGIADYTID